MNCTPKVRFFLSNFLGSVQHPAFLLSTSKLNKVIYMLFICQKEKPSP